MPGIEEATCCQDALLWEFLSDDEDGEAVVDEPIELRLRWENRQRLGADRQGNAVTYDVTAWLARSVTPNSQLWEGSLDDYNRRVADSETIVRYRVVTCDRVTDIINRVVQYCLGLQRLSSRVPNV